MSAAAVVKERPILFTGPMVRALLAGTKTQTRRTVKPDRWMATAGMSLAGATRDPGLGDGEYLKVPNLADGTRHRLYCPYGSPGERLWVRETWWRVFQRTPHNNGCVYRADYLRPTRLDPTIADQATWKPSIHMPRWASRIVLEITDVRVERLHAISVADVIAEGVRLSEDGPLHAHVGLSHVGGADCNFPEALDAYRALWSDINGDESWRANPWVWVLTFKPAPA